VLPLAVSREEIVRRGLGFMVHDKQVMVMSPFIGGHQQPGPGPGYQGVCNPRQGDVTLPRGSTSNRVSVTLDRGDVTLPRDPPATRVSVTLDRGMSPFPGIHQLYVTLHPFKGFTLCSDTLGWRLGVDNGATLTATHCLQVQPLCGPMGEDEEQLFGYTVTVDSG
jgi:hypothetical protein